MSTDTGKHPSKVFIGISIEHLDADPVAIAMRRARKGSSDGGT